MLIRFLMNLQVKPTKIIYKLMIQRLLGIRLYLVYWYVKLKLPQMFWMDHCLLCDKCW